MKSIVRLFVITALALIAAGCATRNPLPQVTHITTTEYIVVEVPASYTAPTSPTAPINLGCVGVVDWKECAASRSKTLVNLYGDIGQCNADKAKTRNFITEQTKIVQERNKKKP